jgi:hypothetical protein
VDLQLDSQTELRSLAALKDGLLCQFILLVYRYIYIIIIISVYNIYCWYLLEAWLAELWVRLWACDSTKQNGDWGGWPRRKKASPNPPYLHWSWLERWSRRMTPGSLSNSRRRRPAIILWQRLHIGLELDPACHIHGRWFLCNRKGYLPSDLARRC